MSSDNGSGDISAPEFSRMIDRRTLGAAPVALQATAEECTALAERFAIPMVNALNAELALLINGETVAASGNLQADIVQSCAISGDDLPVTIEEELSLTFVPEREITEEEIELEEGDLDEIPYAGTSFDLGEAVAQSLALAIDPYLTGPDAERVREIHDLAEKGPSGPLQDALKGLRGD